MQRQKKPLNVVVRPMGDVRPTSKNNSLPLDEAPRVTLRPGLESRYGLCPPDLLIVNPNSVRTHPRRQLKKIARSMDVAGPLAPIIVDENYMIHAGHGRVAAAKESGSSTVPVVQVFGLTMAQKRVFLLADNRVSEDAGLDRQKLAQQLPELTQLFDDAGFELTDTGFEIAEVDELVYDLETKAENEEENLDAKLYEEPVVLRSGDLLQLGNHRLIVGDARDLRVLDTLMSGDIAEAAFLDPPYNVKVSGIVGARQGEA